MPPFSNTSSSEKSTTLSKVGHSSPESTSTEVTMLNSTITQFSTSTARNQSSTMDIKVFSGSTEHAIITEASTEQTTSNNMETDLTTNMDESTASTTETTAGTQSKETFLTVTQTSTALLLVTKETEDLKPVNRESISGLMQAIIESFPKFKKFYYDYYKNKS